MLVAKRTLAVVPATPRAEVHLRATDPLPRLGILRSRRVRVAASADKGVADKEWSGRVAEFRNLFHVSCGRMADAVSDINFCVSSSALTCVPRREAVP